MNVEVVEYMKAVAILSAIQGNIPRWDTGLPKNWSMVGLTQGVTPTES